MAKVHSIRLVEAPFFMRGGNTITAEPGKIDLFMEGGYAHVVYLARPPLFQVPGKPDPQPMRHLAFAPTQVSFVVYEDEPAKDVKKS